MTGYTQKISHILISLVFIFLTGCVRRIDDIERTRFDHAVSDMALINTMNELPTLYLTIDDIIQIALEQNLELMVKAQEYAIQQEIATGSTLKMLPTLIANNELSGRNNNTGASSQSLIPNIPPAPPSISSEQHVDRFDITLTWNLIDFGVSYYRARQEANRIVIKHFEYQRARQNVVLDVTRKFWLALAARHAIESGTTLTKEGERYQAIIDKLIQKRLLSTIVGLKLKTQILDNEIQLRNFQKDYHDGMTSLGQIMGLPPNQKFELVYDHDLEVDVVLPDSKELEELALLARPELYTSDIEEKLSADEVRVALLQLFPSASLFASEFNDSNFFLIHRHWLIAGLRSTWNLFAIPFHTEEAFVAQAQKERAKLNRLAVSMGVISQVHLAKLVYQDNLEQFFLLKEMERVKKSLRDAAMKEQKYGEFNGEEALLYSTEALMAEINAIKAYGDAQVTLETLNNSMGMPLYFRNGIKQMKNEE
jgi:multidrug efflux system outer membrane protein